LKTKDGIFAYYRYGQTEVNPIAIAYYRYERIIEDIAVFCEQILGSDDGDQDRQLALEYL
jgi:spectinomycin phosphotransferase